ncbi:unnamed protein product [Nippostrongylus brasiliensis]|uniref:Ovule protein n=1 Tax=Nippostrongylus brasiliensis TaxID=27835 RepID=A0A0N4Y7I3_NIPBR|nr:hypothetical protein Q1695_012686 [Nippostrongylus brasiliensis]VDL75709.1 unnamed protein product [Nippostrongylus brasiliensis]
MSVWSVETKFDGRSSSTFLWSLSTKFNQPHTYTQSHDERSPPSSSFFEEPVFSVVFRWFVAVVVSQCLLVVRRS